jgi:hypothetical protein
VYFLVEGTKLLGLITKLGLFLSINRHEEIKEQAMRDGDHVDRKNGSSCVLLSIASIWISVA